MKPLNWMRLIKIWGVRAVMIALIAMAVNRWGVPLYKQYFTPKKTVVFVPTAKVRSGDFTVSFHEIGTLEAERSTPINAEVGGKIIYLVDDGTVVKTGDKLVEMDTEEVLREVRREQLNHRNALAEVDRVKAEQKILEETNKTDIGQQQAELDFNQTELKLAQDKEKKKQQLAAEKLVPRTEVDAASTEVRAKELQVKKGTMQLELKKKEVASKESQKAAEVKKVEFAADIARSTFEEAQNRVNKAIMLAPASGIVVIVKDWTPDGRRKLREGDSVHSRHSICNIPDLSSMLVKVQVGESDAPRVKPGVKCAIKLEAVPRKRFHGTVTDISNLAEESDPFEGGASTPRRKNFEVTVAVKETDPKTLKPGMTADVEFICDTVTKARYVPLESVFERNEKTYVFVKNGKRYERRDIVTGKRNDNFVCVTKGLRDGEVISLRDPTKPLDLQEAGSTAPGAEQDKKKAGAAPIPEASKKKK